MDCFCPRPVGNGKSDLQLSAWEFEFSILNFRYLQNRSEKMYAHALHTVHALPELRVVAGRLRDGVSVLNGTEHSLEKANGSSGMRRVKDVSRSSIGTISIHGSLRSPPSRVGPLSSARLIKSAESRRLTLG